MNTHQAWLTKDLQLEYTKNSATQQKDISIKTTEKD